MLGSELDSPEMAKRTRRVCRTPRNEISESRSSTVVSTAQRRRRQKTSIAAAFAGLHQSAEAADCSAAEKRSNKRCRARFPHN